MVVIGCQHEALWLTKSTPRIASYRLGIKHGWLENNMFNMLVGKSSSNWYKLQSHGGIAEGQLSLGSGASMGPQSWSKFGNICYPLVMSNIAIENGHLYWIFSLKMVDRSIVMLVYQRVLISISEDSEINITRQIWEYVICMILYVVFTGAQGIADFLSQNSGHPTFLVNGPSRPFKLAPLAPRQTFEQGLPGRRPRGCFWPWDAGDFSPSKNRMNRSDRELWWATCPSATHLPPEVASIRHPDWFQSPWPQQPGQGLFHVGIWHDLLAVKPEKTWVFCWAWFLFGDFFELDFKMDDVW